MLQRLSLSSLLWQASHNRHMEVSLKALTALHICDSALLKTDVDWSIRALVLQLTTYCSCSSLQSCCSVKPCTSTCAHGICMDGMAHVETRVPLMLL